MMKKFVYLILESHNYFYKSFFFFSFNEKYNFLLQRKSRRNVNCECLFVYVNMVNTDCSEKEDLAAYPMFNQKM